ncbi:MAG: amino acid permease [Imperialibacter sp.]|uniref:amino acid permease n=1 Tax=Imperialibacter sp. TaxID=2038411 RepID=UPI0032EC0D6C
MINQLFARKPAEWVASDIKTNQLKRVLSRWNLTTMGVGAIIGAGIFVMTGLAAREYAGPALAISFIIAGLGCSFAALCYAEFASIYPVEGSAYSYSYATIGELFAWIIGWDLILEYAMAASTVAVGWSGYFGKLLGLLHIHLPLWISNDLQTARALVAEASNNGTMPVLEQHYTSLALPEVFGISLAINLPAIIIVLIVTAIITIGVRETAGTNLWLVAIKVSVVLFVIVAGVFFIDTANWSPFIPARGLNGEGVMAFGLAGITAGAAYIFFAYIGFDAVATQAAESKNPTKDLPFAIIASLVICTILYIAVSLVVTGMVNYTLLDKAAPVAAAFMGRGMNFAVWIISIAAVAGLTSVLLVMTMGQTRILMAMSKDGLLPAKIFAYVHPRLKTPSRSSILVGILIALVAGFTPIDTIAKLVNIGTLLAFVLVCISVWRLRYTQPDLPRPFRVKALPLVAILGIVFNFGMMLSLEWENWLRLLIWLLIGLAIYFFYSRKRSLLGKHLKEGNETFHQIGEKHDHDKPTINNE